MQTQQVTPNLNALLLTSVVVALAAIAILRSPRKWHTALYIIGCMTGSCAVGTGIGFALHHTAESAGSVAGFLTQWGGLIAAIERIRFYRKPKGFAV
jgi:hypothetical protein